MAFITDTPLRPAAPAQRLLALLGWLKSKGDAPRIDGEKAQAANLRREAARRATDNLLR